MSHRGVVTPLARPNQHQVVINDAAFSTYVGEAAEYNSAQREYAAPFARRLLTPRLIRGIWWAELLLNTREGVLTMSNEVREGIQQAKVGAFGLGIIALEVSGLSYYAGYMTESTGLGLLAFVVLLFILFGVSDNEKVSAWFSLILGAL